MNNNPWLVAKLLQLSSRSHCVISGASPVGCQLLTGDPAAALTHRALGPSSPPYGEEEITQNQPVFRRRLAQGPAWLAGGRGICLLSRSQPVFAVLQGCCAGPNNPWPGGLESSWSQGGEKLLGSLEGRGVGCLRRPFGPRRGRQAVFPAHTPPVSLCSTTGGVKHGGNAAVCTGCKGTEV